MDAQSGGNEDLLVLWGYWVCCTESVTLDSASEQWLSCKEKRLHLLLQITILLAREEGEMW